jgi:hypothetical protein
MAPRCGRPINPSPITHPSPSRLSRSTHETRRLVPLRRRAVPSRISPSLSFHALLLFDLPKDRWSRRLRHQPQRGPSNARDQGKERHRRVSRARAGRRHGQTHAQLGAPAFLQALRQRAVAVGPAMASWVEVQSRPRDKKFDEYPQESIAAWHQRLGLQVKKSAK